VTLHAAASSTVEELVSAQEVLYAAAHNPDLIGLGVRPEAGHLGAATHLPRTTAHQVLARGTACPVLTVQA
jgi:hypothetical protein